MDETARMVTIEQQCRADRTYPDALTRAIVAFLQGHPTLDLVLAEWRRIYSNSWYGPSYQHLEAGEPFLALSAGEDLDALDLRLLDLSVALDRHYSFLYAIRKQARIKQAFEHLQCQENLRPATLQSAIRLVRYAIEPALAQYVVEPHYQLTALGQFLLTYLPADPETLLTAFTNLWEGLRAFPLHEHPPAISALDRWYDEVVHLLLIAHPPLLDLAWLIIQHWDQAPPHRRRGVGHCATLVLQADPERFTAWARTIADPDGPDDDVSQAETLAALMRQNPARHVDLAIKAAETPLPTGYLASITVQCTGLALALRFDPVTYWPLLKAAAQSQHADMVRYACQLLAYKRIHEPLGAWLADKGGAGLAEIAPLLSLPLSCARRAVVQMLARLGGEAVADLLTARLAVEKSALVRKAILEALAAGP
jgi:hypothetical protein